MSNQQPELTDDELDIAILDGLRIQREGLSQGAWNVGALTVANIAAMVDHPLARVEARVADLAAEGRIEESDAAPGRWMIA